MWGQPPSAVQSSELDRFVMVASVSGASLRRTAGAAVPTRSVIYCRAISGTAATAARMPAVFQQVNCSLRKNLASNTVNAG